MSKDQNIAAQEAFGAAVNSGNLDQLATLVGPGDVDHDPAPQQGPGAQGFQDMFAELRTAFPDLHIEVEHLTATEDDVAFAYTVPARTRVRCKATPPPASRSPCVACSSVASRTACSSSAGAAPTSSA